MQNFGDKLVPQGIPIPNSKYVSCPYNLSHRVLRTRMQYHLVKCKRVVKEKPEDEKSVCPFDATHHVDKAEFDEHVKTCPNRKIMESEKFAIESEDKKEEEPASGFFLPDLPPCEENWDDPDEAVYTYNPSVHLENQPILRTMHGATKSERKAFRQVERMKMIQFNAGQPMNTEIAAAAVGVTVENGRYIGRGRGKGPLPLGRGKDEVDGLAEDLDKILGDVGHIVPCQVDGRPLRQPRESSIAVAVVKEDALMEELQSTSGFNEHKEDRDPQYNASAPFSDSASTDFHCSDNSSKVAGTGRTSKLLEEFKEKVQQSRLAIMALEASEGKKKDADDRARAFTYYDEEWKVQRGRSHRGHRRGILPKKF